MRHRRVEKGVDAPAVLDNRIDVPGPGSIGRYGVPGLGPQKRIVVADAGRCKVVLPWPAVKQLILIIEIYAFNNPRLEALLCKGQGACRRIYGQRKGCAVR